MYVIFSLGIPRQREVLYLSHKHLGFNLLEFSNYYARVQKSSAQFILPDVSSERNSALLLNLSRSHPI